MPSDTVPARDGTLRDLSARRDVPVQGVATLRGVSALATVEVIVITALAVTAVAGRDYLEPVLRLLLAVLVLAFSIAVLVARRGAGAGDAKSAADLLGAATGDPVEAARENGASLGMRLVLQVFAGLAVGIGVLVAGDVLLDPQAFRKLVVILGVAVALTTSFALGRFTRPVWTAAILPALWVMSAAALGVVTGGLDSPRDWLVIAGGAVVLLVFWVIARRRTG
ncbi:hypothetical protein I7648_04735 [Collinsella tanakaei]|nr:hypothetical protein [Collinsella tanakaei]